MAPVCVAPGRGESRPGADPGITGRLRSRDVTRVLECLHLLAQDGLADACRLTKNGELRLVDGIENRADPEPVRGVDDRVECGVGPVSSGHLQLPAVGPVPQGAESAPRDEVNMESGERGDGCDDSREINGRRTWSGEPSVPRLFTCCLPSGGLRLVFDGENHHMVQVIRTVLA